MRSNTTGRPRPRFLSCSLASSAFLLVIIFGVIAPKILEQRLPEPIFLLTYWSASSRYQPRRTVFPPLMTTTWQDPLDTLERPARAISGAGRTAAEFRTAWQGLTESLMDQITDSTKIEREMQGEPRPRRRTWRTAAMGVVPLPALLGAWYLFAPHKGNQPAAVPTPALPVTVSQPLQR